MAAVCVPKPPKACRAVGKAPPLAHAAAVITLVDALNSSVAPVCPDPGVPPATYPAD